MKKTILYLILPFLVLLLLGGFLYWKYLSLSSQSSFVRVNVESQHSSIESLNMGEKQAWDRLLAESKIGQVGLIYSNPNIVIEKPLQLIQIVITDKEQNSTRIVDGTGKILSTTGLTYDAGTNTLKILIHIPKELVSDEQVNALVENAIWAASITNEKNPEDQSKKINSFQEYLKSSNTKLISDIDFNL